MIRGYYNPERKAAFIDSLTPAENSRLNISRILTRASFYERSLGLDLCEFNVEQLQDFFDQTGKLKSKSSEYYLIVIRQYIKWCEQHGFDTTDAIQHIRRSNDQRLKKHLIASPDDLKRTLDVVYPDVNDDTIRYVYRAWLWLAFIGLRMEETEQLSTQDIDFTNMKISRQNKEDQPLDIYPQAVQDLLMACVLDKFLEPSPHGGKPILKERVDGDLVMRTKRRRNKDESVGQTLTFIAMLSRRLKPHADNDQISCEVTYQSVRDSGIYYRIFLKEQELGEAAFDEFVDERVRNGKHKVGKINTPQRIQYLARKSIYEDYIQWKNLFYGL